jgi:hypothetical protein
MAKSSEPIKELQRSMNRLQRADGTVLHLGGRAYLVASEAVLDPDALLELFEREDLSETAALDGLASSCRLRAPARWIAGRWLGALQHDLKLLEMHRERAALTREAPRLFRGRTIDREWIAGRRAQLARLQEVYAREALRPRALPSWQAVLEVARSFFGEETAAELENIRERSTAVSAGRRREALRRAEELARRLEGEAPSNEEARLAAFLDETERRLRQVGRWPGRARRRHLPQVVAAVVSWPALLTVEDARTEATEPLAQQVRALASQLAAQLPSTRSPEYQERLAVCLSRYGLLFPPSPGSGLVLDERFVQEGLRCWPAVKEQLAGLALRLEQALALLALPGRRDKLLRRGLGRAGRWVAEGLEVSLLHDVARLRLLDDLVAEDWDVETARAYCQWVTRLAPHYRQHGVELALTPQAFPRLRGARREDLAVLGLCLLEHHTTATGRPTERRIALLDATLALFQRVPERARACLEGLDRAPAGLAATVCPAFAAWLEQEPNLDRYLHLRDLLGLPQAPAKSLLRDFERAARRSAELAYLAALADAGEGQRRRADQLSRSTPPPGPAWTRRRLAERTEALAAELLERRLDQALAEILRHAFGLALARVTPAWRDAFRFYLATYENQDLLGLLLRNAAANPGRYFPPTLEKNRRWLERAAARGNIEAWLRPRCRAVELAGKRCTLAVEEDPIEVLRMGIPFNTCLALADGCHAAATVLNALDVNKRVLFLKDATGTPVARQLIAVSQDFTLLTYRLYSALPPEHAAQVEQAFRNLCKEIAQEAGLPFGDRGEPENLHGGVWYDDGVAPFGGSDRPPVAAAIAKDYCRSLGLPIPPMMGGLLLDEAEIWAAAQARDLERFERAGEGRWSWPSLALCELGECLVEDLGPTGLTQRHLAGARGLLAPLLWHRAAEGAEALLRAARQLVRSPEETEVLYGPLRSLPRSVAVLEEIAFHAARTAARGVPFDEHGLEHASFRDLPHAAGDLTLAQLLDLCDRLAPVWDWMAEQPYCVACRATAERGVLAAVERVFIRQPDARLAVACLRARRRSRLAQRVALRVLALFPLSRRRGASLTFSALTAFERAPSDAPWAREALGELAARRPELGGSSEMLAACLRQGASVDLASWPLPDEPPFWALGDLVLHVPALLPWLTEHFGAPQVDAALLRDALGQLWRERQALPEADASSHPDLAKALDVLLTAELAEDVWVGWISAFREETGGVLGPLLVDAVARWLRERSRRQPGLLTPDLTLWLWSFPALQEPLLGTLGLLGMPEAERFYRGLLETARPADLDPQDLLERWIVAVLEAGYLGELAATENRGFLDLVIRSVLKRASPERWIELYEDLSHPLPAALFLRELARQPEPSRRELRERLQPQENPNENAAMFRFWLERELACAT